jgi:hypothetical protein
VDPIQLERTLGQRDRGRHREHADDVLGGRGEERGDQSRGPKAGPAKSRTWTIPSVTTEHRKNWAMLKAGLTERCRRLMTSARPAPMRRARMNSRAGRRRSVDDRDLAHRERMRAPADVEVDDPRLGHVEERRQQPDGDPERRVGGPAVAELHPGGRAAAPSARRSGPRPGTCRSSGARGGPRATGSRGRGPGSLRPSGRSSSHAGSAAGRRIHAAAGPSMCGGEGREASSPEVPSRRSESGHRSVKCTLEAVAPRHHG